MPHVYDIVGQLFEPSRRNGPLLIDVLLDAALFTAKEAAAGFVLGATVGFAIAVVLSESRLLQRGFLPYIVASQTIPILAIAPMVVVWVSPKLPDSLAGLGRRGRDRRLPDLLPGHDQHAARAPVGRPARGRADALVRRRPLADPLEGPRSRLVPVPLRRAQDRGAGGVVGAIIGELPSSIQDGLAGAILNFNQYYVSSPPSLWATNIIAAALGIVFFVDRRRRREAARAPGSGERRMTDARRAVSIKGLSKRFERGDVLALEQIDLDVQPGEFVSLIGPSGCGKSTLLRIIGDLIRPTEGDVLVNGKSAHDARVDRDYGIVFQDAVLYDWRNVSKNIALPLEMAGWDKRRREERVREMLDLVELTGFEKHHPWQLSGGMQQRVSIARALSFSPALLLMDEPFGALDEMTRERMNNELLRIWQDDALDGGLRHALDRGVGLPLDPRRRHVGPAGADRRDRRRSTCRSRAGRRRGSIRASPS